MFLKSSSPTIREQILEIIDYSRFEQEWVAMDAKKVKGHGKLGCGCGVCTKMVTLNNKTADQIESLISQSVIEARLDEVNLAGNRMATITTFTEAGYNLMMEHLGKRIVEISMGKPAEELKTLANKGDKIDG